MAQREGFRGSWKLCSVLARLWYRFGLAHTRDNSKRDYAKLVREAELYFLGVGAVGAGADL